jgi:AraC-like DNA-binding protein
MVYVQPQLLTIVRDHLQRRPGTPFADLAMACRVSPSTLARAIRVETGRSFRTLRRDILLDRAAAELSATPSRTIKEVSTLLGFEAQRSFARWFRHQCDCSPSAYRAACVGGPTNTAATRVGHAPRAGGGGGRHWPPAGSRRAHEPERARRRRTSWLISPARISPSPVVVAD